MPSNQLDEARQGLSAKRASLRCEEVVALLESLGFEVRAGKSPGHKVYTHTGLKDFYTSSFNCGHGKNPEVKSSYISNVLRVLTTHETALRAYLDGKDNE